MANLFATLKPDEPPPAYRLESYQTQNISASEKLCDSVLGVGTISVETALDLGGKPLYYSSGEGKEGMNCLHLACRSADTDTIELLLASYVEHSNDKNALRDALLSKTHIGQETPILIAAEAGNLSVLMLLLSKEGADPLATNGYGSSMLHLAVRASHNTLPTVKAILSWGTSENPSALSRLLKGSNNRGVGVVTHALFAEPEETAEALVHELVAAGADVNQSDREGMRALHHAAIIKSATLIKTLLSLGAEKSAHDEYGRTASDVLKAMAGKDTKMTQDNLALLALF